MAAEGRGNANPAAPGASMAWLMALPARFRDELSGLADGAGLRLQRVADWVYLEPALSAACTAAVCLFRGRAWIARNNDTHASDMWGYVTVREPAGRIPWISFCLEGDVFTPTGYRASSRLAPAGRLSPMLPE